MMTCQESSCRAVKRAGAVGRTVELKSCRESCYESCRDKNCRALKRAVELQSCPDCRRAVERAVEL